MVPAKVRGLGFKIHRERAVIPHLAASLGYEKIVEMVLKIGVEVSAVDLVGDTALHLATQGGHEKSRCCRKAGQILMQETITGKRHCISLPAEGMGTLSRCC